MSRITNLRTPADARSDAPGMSDSAPPIEKRREPRLATNQIADIIWTDDSGEALEERVRIVNVSMSGFAFFTKTAFQNGSELTLRAGNESYECVVRHIENHDGTRYAGVEILTRPASDNRRDLRRLSDALRRHGN